MEMQEFHQQQRKGKNTLNRRNRTIKEPKNKNKREIFRDWQAIQLVWSTRCARDRRGEHKAGGKGWAHLCEAQRRANPGFLSRGSTWYNQCYIYQKACYSIQFFFPLKFGLAICFNCCMLYRLKGVEPKGGFVQ